MFKGIKNYLVLHKLTVLGGLIGFSVDLFVGYFPLFTGVGMLVLALASYVFLEK